VFKSNTLIRLVVVVMLSLLTHQKSLLNVFLTQRPKKNDMRFLWHVVDIFLLH